MGAHIRSQLWTTIPAWVMGAALFLVLGLDLGTGAGELPETAVVIMEQLDALFAWSPLLLLPIVVLLGLALLKKPVVPTHAHQQPPVRIPGLVDPGV